MDTQVGSIAAMLDATVEPATLRQREVQRIGCTPGIAVVVIAVVVVGTLLLVSDIRSAGDVVDVLLLGVALAVAAVPERLPHILSVVLALGVQCMARQHASTPSRHREAAVAGGAAGLCFGDLYRQDRTLTRSQLTIERIYG